MAKYSKGDYTNCRCNICEIVDEDGEIDTTNSISKKEVYRKKHEKISRELDDLLKYMKIQD